MSFGAEEERPTLSEDTVVLPPRPQTALDLAAAKLVGTLRSRPGHVVVVGESALEAHGLFQAIESQLGRFLRLMVDGREINPEAVVRGLWEADGRTATSGGRPLAMMRVLAGEAGLAGRPIIVTVTEADAATAGQLERLRQMVESVPAAEEVVRIVLLGGPALIELLARPEARAVAMRVVASVRVPSVTSPVAATLSPPVEAGRPRSRAPLALGALVVGLAALAWLRTASVPPPAPPVVAAPTPVVPEAPAVVAPEPVAPEPVVVVAPAEPVPPPAPLEPPVVRSTAPVRPAPSAPAASRELALQVGAFTTAANAEELRRRLGDRFGATSVSSVERDGRRYYRVRVSGFTREADRRAAATALRGAGFSPVPVRD